MAAKGPDKPPPRDRRKLVWALIGFVGLAVFMYVTILYKIINYGP